MTQREWHEIASARGEHTRVMAIGPETALIQHETWLDDAHGATLAVAMVVVPIKSLSADIIELIARVATP